MLLRCCAAQFWEGAFARCGVWRGYGCTEGGPVRSHGAPTPDLAKPFTIAFPEKTRNGTTRRQTNAATTSKRKTTQTKEICAPPPGEVEHRNLQVPPEILRLRTTTLLPVRHLLLGREGAGVREGGHLRHAEVARADHVHALPGLEVGAPHVAKHGDLSIASRILQNLPRYNTKKKVRRDSGVLETRPGAGKTENNTVFPVLELKRVLALRNGL